ncbi:MAG: SCO family protein [Bdellovibrionales bacterium]|nr:SCO family protein [Bdellovibrionales bacterium]
MSKILPGLTFAAVLALVLGGASFALLPRTKPTLPELYPAPAFELIAADGSRLSSESLKGKVWIANFFFTSCRGPCPLQMQHLKQVIAEFEEESDLAIVSITVDPVRDNLRRLTDYAANQGIVDRRWHLVRAEHEELSRLLNEGFRLGSADEVVNHSTRLVLVDRKGMIRDYFDGVAAPEIDELKRAVPALLATP